MSDHRERTPHSREHRDREPKPVAADVAFISTADATGVGDSEAHGAKNATAFFVYGRGAVITGRM